MEKAQQYIFNLVDDSELTYIINDSNQIVYCFDYKTEITRNKWLNKWLFDYNITTNHLESSIFFRNEIYNQYGLDRYEFNIIIINIMNVLLNE